MQTKPTIEEEAANFWAKYFCVCGDTEQVLAAFEEILGVFVWREATESYAVDLAKWKAYAGKHGEGLAFCILYWLEGMDLTEHGGSVLGSWMTRLGSYIKAEVEDGTPEFFREVE